MNTEEIQYLNLLNNILQNGSQKSDRTGTGTLSLFGTQLKFSLKDNQFPLLTTKKMFWKGIVEELLFFLRGETNTKKLEEKGVNIWKGNSSREFLDKRGLTHYPEGEIGPMYGKMWRSFGSYGSAFGKTSNAIQNKLGIDQLKNALELIKTDPNSRRIMVTAYNPLVSKYCVLEPCHTFYQFYIERDQLSCQWYQRSVDCFLGLGFNIASYAILTILMAKASGLKAKELIFIGGDTHIYSNHIEQVKEQLKRTPYSFPKLQINKAINTIEDMEQLTFEDFEIKDYKYYSAIKAEMPI